MLMICQVDHLHHNNIKTFFCIVYVGAATVFASAWWFMYYENGPQLNYYQLVK